MAVAQVTATTVIRAPLPDVYRQAQDVEAFPSFMPDLQSVRVLERDGPRTVTEWVGTVQGRRVRWVEEDTWDDDAHRCTFRQREGDFTRYEGVWTFAAVPEGTQTTLTVDFELDLPLAGPLLSTLLRVLVRKNVESMLEALRLRLEGGARGAPTSRSPGGG
ncbi:MAG: SRPBCC family protein [Armatimonadota bacterium]|nr:SRPBCC family protein [Armatimonadota bacterium]MDR7400678.1 SRPBCC family protein [Armatimonadota bacterium]MDR7403611.1 SRPBCC family protein [Armatimonadota bacterium]MDR7436511.1 SRPBCC family protein [Armatimonadota bacterium]MDR7472546.1 SRPBCC family protein [Armatimonadota bacterium]